MRWRSLAVLSSTDVSSTASADISMMRFKSFVTSSRRDGRNGTPPSGREMRFDASGGQTAEEPEFEK
jgi:hypothetical protein